MSALIDSVKKKFAYVKDYVRRHESTIKRVLRSRMFFFIATLIYPVYKALCHVVFRDEPYELEWFVPHVAVFVCLALFLLGLWASHHWHKEALLTPRKLWLVLVLALAYSLMGDFYLYDVAGWQIGIPVYLVMGVLCLLWVVLRHVSILLWAACVLLGLVQVVSEREYGVTLNPLVMQEALEASHEEIMAYLSVTNICLLVLCVAMVGLVGWFHIRVMRGAKTMPLLNTGLLCCTFSCALGTSISGMSETTEHFWPLTEAYRVGEIYFAAVETNVETVNLLKNLPSPALDPSSISTVKGDEGLVVVVHIGESVRADRLSLNGYHRKTTPWLDSQVGKRLINFPNCTAAAFLTCQSQIVMLTDARRDMYVTEPEMKAHVGSVLDLFDANGFHIYAFLGRRAGEQLKYDRVIHLLSSRCKKRYNAPKSPWTGVPQVEEVLRANPKQNLVLLINNEGSHVPFGHFDEDNPPFAPVDDTFTDPPDHAEEINNAYDSTIHYTDEYIRRVVSLLEGRPFVYVYMSDHGECLGQDGMWGRGPLWGDRKVYFQSSACNVGMFVIYSPEFEQLHPHFAEALRQLSEHSQMSVGHEHLFHTLLGLVGITSPHYKETLDLCSPAVQPYTGPRPGDVSELDTISMEPQSQSK